MLLEKPCFQSRIFLQNMTLPPSPPLYLQCMQWRGFSDVPPTQNPKFPRQTSPPTLHQGIGHNAAAARKRSHWPRQDITNAHASKLFLQECPNFPRGALLCYWTAYSRPVSSSRCEKCTRDPHTLWSPHPVSRDVPVLAGYRCIERRAEHSEAIYVAIGQPTVTSVRARGAKDAPEIHTHCGRRISCVLALLASSMSRQTTCGHPVISEYDESLYAISSKRELRLQRREEC